MPFGPFVLPAESIIEAFPNTFTGVLLPEESFVGWSKALRMAKSDWLYERVVEAGLFRNLLSKLDLASLSVLKKFEQAQQHDELLSTDLPADSDVRPVRRRRYRRRHRWWLVLATPDDIMGSVGIGGI